jgi:uncharacterized protein YndB with AHSA1/START domain
MVKADLAGDAIVIDIFYPHPVRQVWEALTDQQALATWLMPNDFVPRLGHRLTFVSGPERGWNGTIYCQVVQLDADHCVSYTWRGGSSGLDTLVTFTLEPAAGGTLLRLEHSGFASGGEAGLTMRDLLASGWNSRILRERLPAFLNQQAV